MKVLKTVFLSYDKKPSAPSLAGAENQKHTPPKHHTIDAILGLKSGNEVKDERTELKSSGEQ